MLTRADGDAEGHFPPQRIPRQEFLTRYWDYRAGEHVTMLAPTQNGKTTFSFDLLANVPPQKNLPVMLVMKPRDETVSRGIERLKYRRIQSWPPPPSIRDMLRLRERPRGWALWPRPTFNLRRDRAVQRYQFEKCLLDCYAKGDRIIVADETFGLVDRLGLDDEITDIHTQGAGMGVGLWCMTQKPTHIGRWAYSQAVHLFLGRDPDRQSRQRFSEIGGIDSELVERYVMSLEKYEWLYICRNGPTYCIVRAE